MKKLIKIGLALLVVFCIVLVIAYLNLSKIANTLRPTINAKVVEITGDQNTEIGEMTLALFPNIAIAIEDSKIFGQNLGKVSLNTALMPLLSGDLKVESLNIENTTLNIKEKEDGGWLIGSFDPDKLKTAPVQGSSKKDSSKVSKQAASDKKDSFEIKVDQINLDGISVNIEKLVKPKVRKTISIEDLSGDITHISTFGSADLDLTAALGVDDKKVADIRLGGGVSLPKLKQGKEIELRVEGLDMAEIISIAKPEGLSLSGNSDIKVKAKADTLDFSVSADLSKMGISFQKDGKTLYSKKAGDQLEINTKGGFDQLTSKLSVGSLKIQNKDFDLSSALSLVLNSKIASVEDLKFSSKDLSALLPSLASIDGGVDLSLDLSSGSNFAIDKQATIDLNFSSSSLQLVGQKPISLNNIAAKLNKSSKKTDIVDINASIESLSTDIIDITNFTTLATYALESNTTKVGKFSFNTLDGEISGNALIKTARSKSLNFDVSVTEPLNIGAFSKKLKSSVSVHGTLQKLKASGSIFNLSDPANSHNIEASVSVIDGEIMGFNILRQIVEEFSKLPIVGGSLTNKIPQEFKKYLETDSTYFTSLNLTKAEVRNKAVSLDRLALDAVPYAVYANGKIRKSGELDLDAQFVLKPALSVPLYLKEPKLELMAREDKSLEVPIKIKTVSGRTVVIPDFEKLLTLATKNTAKKGLERVIDKQIKDKLKGKLNVEGAGKLIDSLF